VGFGDCSDLRAISFSRKVEDARVLAYIPQVDRE
jgi:hypothetical protein